MAGACAVVRMLDNEQRRTFYFSSIDINDGPHSESRGPPRVCQPADSHTVLHQRHHQL